MNQTLIAQEGGRVEPQDKKSGGEDPVINEPHGTINMKIRLVADGGDDTLPSYLVPKLNCTKSGSGGSSSTPLSNGSKVKVTLSGANLVKKTTSLTDIKCEITSNFLNEKDKSAITIETYYSDPGNSGKFIKNTIYFDDSLLRCYNNSKQLIESPNPFSIGAVGGADDTYTFNFDFDTIIANIKLLPSYTQIQNMFMFVNGIVSSSSSPPPTSKCLLKISPDAFLNLTFKGVPFIGEDKFVSKGPTLKIETTQPDTTDCTFDHLPVDINLEQNLKSVLDLASYEFDCTKIVSKAAAVASSLNTRSAPGNAQATNAANAATASDQDVKDYEHALQEYNTAIASGDPQKIRYAEAALATALKKPGIEQYLTNKKASVPASSHGKTEIDSTYDAKIKISSNTSANADHNDEFNSIKNNLKNQHVQQHFGLSSTTAASDTNVIKASQKPSINPLSNYKRSDSALTLIGASGESGSCGSGGIGLTSNGKVVTITLPVKMLMSEIVTPKILERLGANEGGGGSGVDVPASSDGQPTIVSSDASASSGGPPSSNAKPQVTITISQVKEKELLDATQALVDLKTKLTTAKITPEPTEIAALNTAITAANTAVAAIENEADKNAAKTAAETKIIEATGLVAAAKTAVEAAIAIAAKIQGLKDKLNAAKQKLQDANQKLKGAQSKLASVNPDPKQVVDTTNADNTLAAADTAIKAIENEKDAAKKPGLIKTAETQVTAAENAVEEFSKAVEAAVANASKPAGNTEPEYAAYTPAYKAYEIAKQAFDSASSTALQTASDTASSAPTQAVEAGDAQGKATSQQIAASKAIFKIGVESVVKGISDDTKGITKIESEKDFNLLTEAGAKQKKIDELNKATQIYNESLAQLTQLQETYEKAIAHKDEASNNQEAAKIGEALGKIGIAIEEVKKAAAASDAADKAADEAAAVSGDAAALAKTAQAAATAIGNYDAAKALATKAAGEAAEAAKAVTDAAGAAKAVTDAAEAVTEAATAVQSDVSGYNTESTGKLTSQKALFERLSDALQQLKESLGALKPAQDEQANDAAQKEEETRLTYTDFYNTFKQCLVVGEGEDASEGNKGEVRKKVVTSDNFLTTLGNCFSGNKFQGVNMLPFFEAVKTASLNSNAKELGPNKFDQNYVASDNDNKINHELLLVIINTLAPNVIFKKYIGESFEAILTELVNHINNNSSELMNQIKNIYIEEEAGGFSLFDGGSTKAKSASKSSSSSSKSKSNSKNKTKKNHSVPKSSKSKTPKIIMNE